jgi:hypothetical protein
VKTWSAFVVSLLLACVPATSAYAKHWYFIGGDFACLTEDPCPGKGFHEGGIKYCVKKSECYEKQGGEWSNECAPQDTMGACD